MFTKNSPCFLKIFYYVPLITILQRFGSLLHVFNYNLLYTCIIDYSNFTIVRVHSLLIIYNNLSITITHEQKWVNTLPNGKQKGRKKEGRLQQGADQRKK